ncbi:hypothetical protein FRB94_012579 [Tulasnella sp. JGI-2019a]|nr:hypothetical protein FRB94_012579 [Tulasnella sp. JGI-2019a]
MKTRAARGASGDHHCQEDGCLKSFTLAKDLRRHVVTVHQRIRNFQCPSCSKSFGQKGGLKIHIQAIHSSNRKPWQCSYPDCEAEFSDGAGRIRHEAEQHAGPDDGPVEKSLECLDCNKVFKRKERLKRHVLKWHPGKREIYKWEQIQNSVMVAKAAEGESPPHKFVFRRPRQDDTPESMPDQQTEAIHRPSQRARAQNTDEDYRAIEEVFAALDGLDGGSDGEGEEMANDSAVEDKFSATDCAEDDPRDRSEQVSDLKIFVAPIGVEEDSDDGEDDDDDDSDNEDDDDDDDVYAGTILFCA